MLVGTEHCRQLFLPPHPKDDGSFTLLVCPRGEGGTYPGQVQGTYALAKVPTPWPGQDGREGVSQGTYPHQSTYPCQRTYPPARSGWGRGYPKVPTRPPRYLPPRQGTYPPGQVRMGGGVPQGTYPPAKLTTPPPGQDGGTPSYLPPTAKVPTLHQVRTGGYPKVPYPLPRTCYTASCVHAGRLCCVAKESVHSSRIFVVTELVYSGTQCSQGEAQYKQPV